MEKRFIFRRADFEALLERATAERLDIRELALEAQKSKAGGGQNAD